MRSLSDEVKSTIEEEIKKSKVVVFMKGIPEAPRCGFSANVVQMLDLVGAGDFHAVDVLEDDDIREGVKEFSDWPTIPQVYVDGAFIGGRDIVYSMYQSGELKTMIGGEETDEEYDGRALAAALAAERKAHAELRESSQALVTSLLARVAAAEAGGSGLGSDGLVGDEAGTGRNEHDAAALAELVVERTYLKDEVVRLRAAALAADADAKLLTAQLEERVVALAREKEDLAAASGKALAAAAARIASLEAAAAVAPPERTDLHRAENSIDNLEVALANALRQRDEARTTAADLHVELQNTRAALAEQTVIRERLELERL
ncbi:uncharacterized protein AMSG_12053 [Thecamonas trahens ATCC 50062]|uniref:Glutaredoxin domain-containing protein n=1 Tax=Thecamonas trahens ATCC 50062 TaxID=461836 RepID=A0A0L0DFG3_THETB|nr:hypothetical protein AMSG_12053 [Thecamonas trahens ATCC 50062]KNC50970.1 hypothetical protein AMSG_12053 [Thecamonas trahens ATCC 50062]|eukprot:XP_013756681.1 hypothetical protein AMSG_12053 [Thecamonas trahens ATCC 50062]